MTQLAEQLTRFLWDFVVGEDWRLAATTVLAIGGAAVLVAVGVNAWWWTPGLVGLGLLLAVAR